jgi:hypothetical protein
MPNTGEELAKIGIKDWPRWWHAELALRATGKSFAKSGGVGHFTRKEGKLYMPSPPWDDPSRVQTGLLYRQCLDALDRMTPGSSGLLMGDRMGGGEEGAGADDNGRRRSELRDILALGHMLAAAKRDESCWRSPKEAKDHARSVFAGLAAYKSTESTAVNSPSNSTRDEVAHESGRSSSVAASASAPVTPDNTHMKQGSGSDAEAKDVESSYWTFDIARMLRRDNPRCTPVGNSLQNQAKALGPGIEIKM